jgi:hypothetical protein
MKRGEFCLVLLLVCSLFILNSAIISAADSRPLLITYPDWVQTDMTKWEEANTTYNNAFGEGNWVTIAKPEALASYDQLITVLDGLEQRGIPFLVTEQSIDGVDKKAWFYNSSKGIALNETQLESVRSNYNMFRGLRAHEAGTYINEQTQEFIEWAFAKNVKIYWNDHGYGWRNTHLSPYTKMMFNGSYKDLVIPLWKTNYWYHEGEITLARGQVLGWWLSDVFSEHGVSFQDWYWVGAGYIGQPRDINGTETIPEWNINNGLWFPYLLGSTVIQIESGVMLHGPEWNEQTSLGIAGNHIRSWYDTLQSSGIESRSRQEVLDNLDIAFMLNSDYSFPMWNSMTQTGAWSNPPSSINSEETRKYHFRAPDYVNDKGDLITYPLVIFYDNEFNENLIQNFSLVVFTDGGTRTATSAEVLENTAKHSDVVVFSTSQTASEGWIDLTSSKSADVLGIKYSSISQKSIEFNTTDTMSFNASKGFTGSYNPDYDQPIRFYDPSNIAVDNTNAVLENDDKNIVVIKEYENSYGKKVYFIPVYYRVYAKWPTGGPGMLRRDTPTLRTSMVQFYSQLYQKYRGDEEEVFFSESSGRVHVIFPFENPATTEELNYTFAWDYSRPYPKTILGNKSRVALSHSFSNQSLTITLDAMPETISTTKVNTTDYTPIYILNTSFNLPRDFDSTNKMLTVNVIHQGTESISVGFKNSASDPLQGNSVLAVDTGTKLTSIPTYNNIEKKFEITLDGTGTNKNISIIYNATQNFEVKDNNQTFASVSDGILDSNNSNSSYQLSYNYSTGIFNFTIPTMSEHNIVFDGDNTAPTITSFSCSPTSVTIGQVVTCSCSATDDTDPNPDVSYTVNPATSEIGTFTPICTATDSSGNLAYSNVSYVVSSADGGNGGGGGGGGGVDPPFYTNTFLMYEKEFSEVGSITILLNERERIRIKVDGQIHHVGIRELYSTTANIEVSSDPQQIIFNIGDENKFDVTEDSFYDLSVILNSIESNKASITITSISGDGIVEEAEEGEEGILDGLGEIVEKSKSKYWIILGVIVLVVAAVIIGIIIKKRSEEV